MIDLNRQKLKSSLFCSCLLHLTLSLLLLSSAVLQVGAQTPGWIKQPAGTMAWLHAVFFLDENRGWVVGSKGTLLATLDGGKTWQPKSAGTTDILRDIYFVDDQNGWLVCEKNVYDLKEKNEARTYLMQTTDGGKQWTRINIRDIDVDIRLLRAVFSRGGGRGWAFGEGGSIYTTRDGGANWARLTSPTRHLLLGGIFIDDDRGWLVGAGSTIIQTADGGDTWHVSRLPQTTGKVRFSAASFVDNRLGWAAGSGGNIVRTVNGGRTWQMQNSGVSADLHDVKFLDAYEGWAVGDEGTIIYTNDGGVHWIQQRSGTVHPLGRIFFAGRTSGWAVGFGGTVVNYVRSEAPTLHK